MLMVLLSSNGQKFILFLFYYVHTSSSILPFLRYFTMSTEECESSKGAFLVIFIYCDLLHNSHITKPLKDVSVYDNQTLADIIKL